MDRKRLGEFVSIMSLSEKEALLKKFGRFLNRQVDWVKEKYVYAEEYKKGKKYELFEKWVTEDIEGLQRLDATVFRILSNEIIQINMVIGDIVKELKTVRNSIPSLAKKKKEKPDVLEKILEKLKEMQATQLEDMKSYEEERRACDKELEKMDKKLKERLKELRMYD